MTRVIRSLLCCAIFSLVGSIGVAQADPVKAAATPGQTLTATGDDVTVRFAGSDAAFDSALFLARPGFESTFFPNHTTGINDSFSLGLFEAGSELMFGLNVMTTGRTFFTGPASRNPDGQVHARFTTWTGTSAIPMPGIRVDFEDLFGGGDSDFNDYGFVVSGAALVDAAPVPEPATVLLLMTGGATILAARRRKRQYDAAGVPAEN